MNINILIKIIKNYFYFLIFLHKIFSAYISLGDASQLDEKAMTPQRTESAHFVGSITHVNMWSRVLDFEQEIPNIVQRCQASPVIFKLS